MTSVKDVKSKEEFDALSANGAQVAVHFWAPWCEPCKQMDVVFARLAGENPSARFVRVEAEEVADVSEHCGVTAVPFFVAVKGGKVVGQVEGADALALTRLVETHLKVAPKPAVPATPPAPAESKEQLFARIKAIVESYPVMLFMKGSPDEPRCGFSGKVVKALREAGAGEFGSFNILADEAVRTGIKEYSNWPTFPQLYVQGELIGGCDIILEMQQSGELRQLIEEKGLAAGGAVN